MKKILLWTGYAVFVVVLVIGAVNRSSSILDNDSEARNTNAHNAENAASTQGNGNSQQDRTPHTDESENHTGKADEHEWAALEGTISTIANRGAVIEIADNQEVGVTGRAWRFAQEQGFTPQIGDVLTITGFYENEVFVIAQMTDLTNGQTAALRDEGGHPLWANARTEH